MPGIFHPEQISKLSVFTKQNIKQLLLTGKYVIVKHHADDKTYVVRPRTKLSAGGLWYDNWGDPGRCVFKGEKGCSFSFDKRPLECQKLVPSVNEENQPNCKHPTDYDPISELVDPWLPYQDILKEIIEEEQDMRWNMK